MQLQPLPGDSRYEVDFRNMSTSANPGHDISRVHLIGIGGSGMSGLASILLDRGATVSGSDRNASDVVAQLQERGAFIATGHAAENLRLSGELPTVVVISYAAIPKDNPELVAAREAGIPVIRRSDLLAELMADYQQILVAGTHGKTSTTSLLVAALSHAGLDPSFAIGGQLTATGAGAHHGSGKAFIAEADESDASLLRYEPSIAIVTNIEPDHLDFFESAAQYFAVFEEFVGRIRAGGTLIACANDGHAAGLAQRAYDAGVDVVLYGTNKAIAEHPLLPCAARIHTIEPTAQGSNVVVEVDGQPVEFEIHLPGQHMALNATAALVAGVRAGGNLEDLAAGISAFGGVRRRFDLRGVVASGKYEGVQVVDDYAHHPTEVTAVLKAARQTVEAQGKQGRVIVAFQPHLYSRTQEFAHQFGQALALADAVICLDIFGAREEPIPGVDAHTVAKAATEAGAREVIVEEVEDNLPQRVAEFARPHDVVITMGAGSITRQGPRILELLSAGQ